MALLLFCFGVGLGLQTHLYSVSDGSIVALADPTYQIAQRRLQSGQICSPHHKTSRLQPPLVLLLDALRASPTRLSLLCVIQVSDPFLATVTARWILTDLVAVALSTADFATYAFCAAGEAMALAAGPDR